jgi:hypothetical protein
LEKDGGGTFRPWYAINARKTCPAELYVSEGDFNVSLTILDMMTLEGTLNPSLGSCMVKLLGLSNAAPSINSKRIDTISSNGFDFIGAKAATVYSGLEQSSLFLKEVWVMQLE